MRRSISIGLILLVPTIARSEDPVARALSRPIIGTRQTLAEVQDFCEARLPKMPEVKSAAEWTRLANSYRADVLEKVVLRGEAKAWKALPTKVEWLDSIEGGPEYRIKKLRIEVVPGLWIPALLYEPKRMVGKVPVVLNLSGHDAKGMATPAKQTRCINLAKKGILALSLEWFGMGQLKSPGFDHSLINTIDLCGTSGISLHYFAQTRALDVLLGLENADPKRVGVTGLSGGGWQTIFVSAIDPRVTLTDPVAGYADFRTRIHYLSDLGDSEQTPCDLATVVDYTHLTAMMAPHPTLLTFNGKDQCCFAAPRALPPLMEAASPIFRLFDKEANLRSHINNDPGDHNYGLDNRLALYRMIADHWSTPEFPLSTTEMDCEAEIRSAEALHVPLPEGNLNFRTLSDGLQARFIGFDAKKPPSKPFLAEQRPKLRAIVRPFDLPAEAVKLDESESDGLHVVLWKIKVGTSWSVPVVELWRGKPESTAIFASDAGRGACSGRVKEMLDDGWRVLAVDPFLIGESQIADRAWLFALLVSAVGERPLGIQAGQLLAIARWTKERDGKPPVFVAEGPRTSLMATVAAALDDQATEVVMLHHSLESLKTVVAEGKAFSEAPELFCFGLLQAFDVPLLQQMVSSGRSLVLFR